MALLAILMCVNFASCSSDDEALENPGKNEYGLPTNIAKNIIVYKTSDNVIIRLNNEDVFGGAKIIENSYSTTNGYGTITFSSEVTEIEEYAFHDFKDRLIAIVLPASVINIGNSAFFDCKNLTSITIPKSVTSIGRSAFEGCTSLTSIKISKSVTHIGENAFKGCSGLTSIVVEKGNKKYYSSIINNNSDKNCFIIETETNTVIAGCGNSNKSVWLPDNVTSIKEYAFYNIDNLKKITFPISLERIGEGAFQNCKNLQFVPMMPPIKNSRLTSIGMYAFYGCSQISSISIPPSVKIIGAYAFSGCSKLRSIYVYATTPPDIDYSTFPSSIYTNPYTHVKVPKGSLAAYKTAYGWKNFSNIEESDY